MSATKRVAPGLYEAPGGYQIAHAFTEGADGAPVQDGWHMLSPTGEWMQWYPTKAAAVADLPTEAPGPAA